MIFMIRCQQKAKIWEQIWDKNFNTCDETLGSDSALTHLLLLPPSFQSDTLHSILSNKAIKTDKNKSLDIAFW